LDEQGCSGGLPASGGVRPRRGLFALAVLVAAGALPVPEVEVRRIVGFEGARLVLPGDGHAAGGRVPLGGHHFAFLCRLSSWAMYSGVPKSGHAHGLSSQSAQRGLPVRPEAEAANRALHSGPCWSRSALGGRSEERVRGVMESR